MTEGSKIDKIIVGELSEEKFVKLINNRDNDQSDFMKGKREDQRLKSLDESVFILDFHLIKC